MEKQVKKEILTEKDARRHQRAWHFLVGCLANIFRPLVNYHFESLEDVPRPYLLMANHNMDIDPILISLAAKKHIYFVATEKITRMGILGWAVKRYFDPIIHNKGVAGIGTVRQVLTYIRRGYSVAIFPEGNRSFSGVSSGFSAATGKMAKACGVTLVTYRTHGSYLTTPRWGKGIRRGRIDGEIAGIYSPEQLKAMSDAEVNDAITRDLYVDAYADQEAHPVKFRRLSRAKGLNSMLFRCPDCGAIGTMVTKRNTISCPCCFTALYDAYGYLVRPDGRKEKLSDLDAAQKQYIAKLTQHPAEELLFSDSVTMEVIRPDHSVEETSTVTLSAYSDRFTLGERVIPFGDLTGIAINQRNLLMLHVRGMDNHYECSGGMDFSALKYLYLIKNGSEL